MAHERKCVIDGTNYKYCAKCGQYDPTELWRYACCCENCRDIYNVIPRYNGGAYTKAEAKKILMGCDLSNLENFNAPIKAIVKEIISGESGNIETVVEEGVSVIDESEIELTNGLEEDEIPEVEVSVKKKTKKIVNEI